MRPVLFPVFLALLALTACPPTTEDDTGDLAALCNDVNEDGEPGHPGREYYLDNDRDVFGAEPVYLCDDPFERVPEGYSPFPGDCDDGNNLVHPDAAEMCDDIDNDCDGAVDNDALDAIQWYADNDGDGYGDPVWGPKQCDAAPGYVDNGDDCDDSSDQIYPGVQDCPE
jgi:hypothetical protein